MLSYNLAPIFKVRGIEKPYTFLVKAGLQPHTAHRILHAQTRVLRLDHLELLCRLLICEPHDLLVWQPNHNDNISATHPLQKLRYQKPEEPITQTLSTLPYEELKKITQTLSSQVTSPKEEE